MESVEKKKLLFDHINKGNFTKNLYEQIKDKFNVDICSDEHIETELCINICYFVQDSFKFATSSKYTKCLSDLLSDNKDFVAFVTKRNVKDFYLPMCDIIKIDNYIPNDELEYFVKRLFLICCLTGTSFRDSTKFSEENIVNGRFFYTNSFNTDISVPIHSILTKYISNDISFSLSGKKRMEILRDIIFKSGVDGTVAIEDSGTVFLYRKSLITNFGTAKVSFATNLYHNGYNVSDIQRFMGLKNRSEVIEKIVGYTSNRIKSNFFD